MDKYEILIHDTFGEDLSYITELSRIGTMLYPPISDMMNSIGPVLANRYERNVHTTILNIVDLKNYCVVEFLVDAIRPHVAVIRRVTNPLLFKS
jgi:hypothetical protein